MKFCQKYLYIGIFIIQSINNILRNLSVIPKSIPNLLTIQDLIQGLIKKLFKFNIIRTRQVFFEILSFSIIWQVSVRHCEKPPRFLNTMSLTSYLKIPLVSSISRVLLNKITCRDLILSVIFQ